MNSKLSKLSKIYNPKQIKALFSTARILCLHGAKRAGKTYVLIIKFLLLVKRHKGKKRKFIIGGATLGTIKANILDDMEALLGYEIKLSKYNNFWLYGNLVMVRPGANSDSWKTVRGFTAYGAFLNEGTALNEIYIKEVISRCSGEGAEIYIDTNPENPAHYIKTDYINNSGQLLESGRTNIQAIHFTLHDNTFLDPVYVESIKKSTPSGMFYDRDIEGKWVSGEGVIYKDFSIYKHVISVERFNQIQIVRRFVGLDWGYEHFGSIVVIAEDREGNLYLEEEVAKQHEQIEFWESEALRIKEKYGNIPFYVDTARPEYVARLSYKQINLGGTIKSVMEGISCVAGYIKREKFFVVEGRCPRFMEEIFLYVWNEKTGEPVKFYDDVLDSVRYAIYSVKRDEELRRIAIEKGHHNTINSYGSYNALR